MSMQDGELEVGLPLTRRATVALGGKFAALTGLVAGLGVASADAKKKKRKKKKKKKKKPQPDFLLVAADMTGDKEVDPNPGDPLASGSGEFTIKGNGTICVVFTFETDTPDSEIILSHIHQGDATINGPVVVDFEGQLENCVPITSSLAAQIKSNPAGFYANIHTNNFEGGAVRAQLSLPA